MPDRETEAVIVFDLDGTLVDTAPDLLDALDHAIATAGLPPVDQAAMRAYAGHGGRAMIERAFAQNRKPLPEAERERLLAVFLDHYTGRMPGRSLPFPGALDAMRRFEDAGFALAICTNKYERLARQLLEGLGLAHRFAAIAGADTFAFRKPDPRHLTETIRRAAGDRATGLMIGDTNTDIATAKAAGLPVVAVEFGYSSEPLASLAPSIIIEHFDELTPVLARRLLKAAGAPRDKTGAPAPKAP
ncbi:phosphoglycolate phosphatase [Zhengella mangrovi]|uniref:Phosphoglycolate phosphatase n=1 Tax=Zhengella mangrovi TaxID=1982044 RepID=A0A2G1QM49_9HYPH|nr:HAD family hydrolase [Zhengella mangrovi]PHP66572.1 phosphoglycolate phosphatase [Zhengella mangrovi]